MKRPKQAEETAKIMQQIRAKQSIQQHPSLSHVTCVHVLYWPVGIWSPRRSLPGEYSVWSPGFMQQFLFRGKMVQVKVAPLINLWHLSLKF